MDHGVFSSLKTFASNTVVENTVGERNNCESPTFFTTSVSGSWPIVN